MTQLEEIFLFFISIIVFLSLSLDRKLMSNFDRIFTRVIETFISPNQHWQSIEWITNLPPSLSRAY